MNPDALCECGHARQDHDLISECIFLGHGCDCEEFTAASESAEIRTRGESDER